MEVRSGGAEWRCGVECCRQCGEWFCGQADSPLRPNLSYPNPAPPSTRPVEHIPYLTRSTPASPHPIPPPPQPTPALYPPTPPPSTPQDVFFCNIRTSERSASFPKISSRAARSGTSRSLVAGMGASTTSLNGSPSRQRKRSPSWIGVRHTMGWSGARWDGVAWESESESNLE